MATVPSAADLTAIDSALRLIDREIWVVTAASEERRGGLTATWVSTASIDRERPVLLAGIAPNHFTAELVQSGRAFAAHLLWPDQVELAWNFANGSGRQRDKLAWLAFSAGQTGSPLLADCLAWFDCRVFAQFDAGDRLFFWADIVQASSLPAGEARVALREHEFIRRLTDDQRKQLLADRNADLAVQRPLHESWRSSQTW